MKDPKPSDFEKLSAQLGPDHWALVNDFCSMVFLDRQGIITQSNAFYNSISGYDSKELLGTDLRFFANDLFPEEFYNDMFTTALKSGVWRGELKQKTKAGNVFWMSVAMYSLIAEDDHLSAFVLLGNDITKIKLETEELRKGFNKKERILNSISDSVISLDNDWRYTFLNDAALSTHPANKQTIRGQRIWEVHPELKGTIFWDKYQEAMSSRKIVEFESYYDPLSSWFSVKVYPTKEGLTILYKDINASKKAEDEILREKNLSDSIINSLTGIFYLYDRNGKFKKWNKNFELVSGYSAEEISSMHPLDFFDGEDKLRLEKEIDKVFNNGNSEVEASFYTKNKTRIPYYFNGHFVHFDGVDYLLGVGIDISERIYAQQAESELNKRLKAIFDGSSDAILLADDNGNYIQANPAAINMLGYSESELLNKSAVDIVSTDNIPELWSEFIDEGNQIGVIGLIKKNGEHILCHYNATSNILPGLHLSILTDITERKKAELELLESEKKYRFLFRNNPLPMWMLSIPEYQIVDVNEAALTHYGYSEKEFLSMNARGLRPLNERSRFEEKVVKEERTGTFYAGKWQHLKKNGEIITVEIVAHDMKFDNRKLRIVLSNDITSKELAEIELKESEARLAEAQSVAKVGSWITDLKTFDVNWSLETFRIFEIDNNLEKKSHPNFLEYVHPDDRENVDRAFQASLNNPNINSIEHRIITPDGKIKTVDERWKIKRDAEGVPVKAIGTCQDITARKQAELAFRESEEKYRYLFNNSPALIIIWDIESFQIMEVNDVALESYGYSREEFLSMNVIELRPVEDRVDIRKFSKSMLTNKTYKLRKTWRHLKKNGEMMFMDITSHHIDFNNKKAILSLAKDITEQVKAEKQLEETYDDIRRLNTHLNTIREEERTSISREIHDELGQQLTGLKMDAFWLRKKLQNEDELYKEKLNGMMALIDDTVKTVRRISSDLRPGVLDDLGLVPALEWQCKEFEKRSGIPSVFITELNNLQFDKDTSTGIFRIYQESLTNIMRHASAKHVQSKLELVDNQLILRIQDDGVGFDLEEIKKKKTLGITGMRERARMFDGDLIIESRPGKGTLMLLKIELE